MADPKKSVTADVAEVVDKAGRSNIPAPVLAALELIASQLDQARQEIVELTNELAENRLIKKR